MDIKDMVFGTIGGLGLFLFGMQLMTDGLKKAAGQKLKSLLEALTKHRVVAVLMGAGVTCLIQSSSATTVMTVGLVNAGLLTLRQALLALAQERLVARDACLALVEDRQLDGERRSGHALAVRIAFTAQARAEDKELTRSIGCVEHYTKPMDPEELINLIRRYLGE